MSPKIRTLINQANAQNSTGPRTPAGKQRSRMNAFKHNLSGQHLILLEHEHSAYHAACERALLDLKPLTEPERQIAQKIIDINFRLNRIMAVESNMYNLDTITLTTDDHPDDRVEIMAAQTRAWKEDAHSFDLLGRYEARLSRQLLAYQKELERLQSIRKSEQESEAELAKDHPAVSTQPQQTTPDTTHLASFGNFVPPPPERALQPMSAPAPTPARTPITEPFSPREAEPIAA